MEKPYSNREMDKKLENLVTEVTNSFNENHTETLGILGRVESQTTKTNGRVTKLEAWRFAMAMAGTIIIVIVIPLLTYIYLDFKAQVEKNFQDMKVLILNQ